jgi:CubicO group peptidase (beta-lactamase class C family)
MRAPLILILSALLLVSTKPAVDAQTNAPKYWPTDGWRTSTPEEQGVDSELLAQAIETAQQRNLAVHSLLVVRNGYLIAEAYFYPYAGKHPHDIASVTKSLTTTLTGIAIAQQKIKSPQEPLLSFFAGRTIANQDERKARITLAHLMTMSSGLDCKAQRGEPTLWEMLESNKDVQHMLDLQMVAEPGANFVYCSGGMHLLSAIISQATGMKTEAFARQTLLSPLGIREIIWPADPQGINHGFGNLHLLPRDMAKLGLLYLNRGNWDGRQIVPAEWVAAATRPQKNSSNTRDYGFGWWIPKSDPMIAYEASGRGGQSISVLPDKNTVIVFNGGGFPAGDVMKMLTPALKSTPPLPANVKGVARLNAAIAAAAKPVVANAGVKPPAIAQIISGKTIALKRNWMGLTSLGLTFQASGTATAQFNFGPSLKQAQFGRSAKITRKGPFSESRPIGVNGATIISPDGPMGLPVAVRGFWENDRTFMLEYDEIANTNTYRLRLSIDQDQVSVHATERTGLFDEKFAGRIVADQRKKLD